MNLYGDLTTKQQRVRKEGFSFLNFFTYLTCMYALGMIIGHIYSVLK